MRLRTCLLAASALGAGGALWLAADIYRRLAVADSLAGIGARPATGDLTVYFSMVHVLGLLALAFLFFSIFLLTSVWSREPAPAPESPQENAPPETSLETVPAALPETPEPEEAIEVKPDSEETERARVDEQADYRKDEGGRMKDEG